MSTIHSEFLNIIQTRGYFHQCTHLEGLDTKARSGELIAYIGFDATANSLHAGSLMQIMLLRWLQQCAGKPIVLLGGGTTKIGDPSGKDGQRQLITTEQIAENIVGIRKVFEVFLTFGDGPSDALLVNNADWLDELQYIDFLREYGRYFSVNRMLTYESVKARLEREQPLSFLEFNYSILQAYDFLELVRQYGCSLQIGGSDQWGNIVAGVDLVRRCTGREAFGLTSPLLVTASGAKMGKTASGAVWLSPDRLNPYDYWQYWRNTEDADVGKFLRLFTHLPLKEIERLETLQGAEINEAKILLANEVTHLCHGPQAAAAAEITAYKTFIEGDISDNLPTIIFPRSELKAGVAAFDLMRRTGLTRSNAEARRLIKGGGARVNNQVLSDEGVQISLANLNDNGVIKLSAGKKRHILVRLNED